MATVSQGIALTRNEKKPRQKPFWRWGLLLGTALSLSVYHAFAQGSDSACPLDAGKDTAARRCENPGEAALRSDSKFKPNRGKNDPAEALKRTLRISTGGPYAAKAGVPITLQASYTVPGQTEISDRLKIIGAALNSYLKDHGSYPPAALLNAQGKPTVSWRVLLLPYLGQQDLYKRFDLSKPWDHRVNRRLLGAMPEVYRKSSAPWDWKETGIAGVGGPEALFDKASKKLDGGRRPEKEGTGMSVTERIAAGPVGAAVHIPWTAPGDIDIRRATKLGSKHGFSGKGRALTPLVFLDGTVYLMPNTVAAGPLNTWTHIFQDTSICFCAPPSAEEVGLVATWDLGSDVTPNPQGWSVPFLAPKPGTYTVTLHVFDKFGNQYDQSTEVSVR